MLFQVRTNFTLNKRIVKFRMKILLKSSLNQLQLKLQDSYLTFNSLLFKQRWQLKHKMKIIRILFSINTIKQLAQYQTKVSLMTFQTGCYTEFSMITKPQRP